MKMKLFSMANAKKEGASLRELETQVNEWLSLHPTIQICDIQQSSSGGSWMPSKLFITIWYEEAS